MLRNDLFKELEDIAREKNSSVNEIVEEWIKVYRHQDAVTPFKGHTHMLRMPVQPVFAGMLMFFTGAAGTYLLAAAVESNLLSEAAARLLIIPLIILAVSLPTVISSYRDRREKKYRTALLQQMLVDDAETLAQFYDESEAHWRKRT